MSCEICGVTNRPLLHHHISYDPEIIQILCGSCHRRVHSNNKDLHKPNNFHSKIVSNTNPNLRCIWIEKSDFLAIFNEVYRRKKRSVGQVTGAEVLHEWLQDRRLYVGMEEGHQVNEGPGSVVSIPGAVYFIAPLKVGS